MGNGSAKASVERVAFKASPLPGGGGTHMGGTAILAPPGAGGNGGEKRLQLPLPVLEG